MVLIIGYRQNVQLCDIGTADTFVIGLQQDIGTRMNDGFLQTIIYFIMTKIRILFK